MIFFFFFENYFSVIVKVSKVIFPKTRFFIRKVFYSKPQNLKKMLGKSPNLNA